MKRTTSIAALVLTIASAVATIPAPSGAAPSAPARPAGNRPVVIYGDSILWQARGNVTFAFARRTMRQVKVQAFGGTALCDWVPAIRKAVAASPRPSAIVLSFSGNTATPCTGATASRPGPAPGTTEFYALNRTAMDAVRSAAGRAGVPVVWVTPPPLGSTTSDHLEQFRLMAERRGFATVDAGSSVTSMPGKYTSVLRCLPDEGASRGCTAGRIRVRADDRVHFFVTRDGYSSGGRRWSEAIAGGVLGILAR